MHGDSSLTPLNELAYVNNISERIVRLLKDNFAEYSVDQLGAAMVYSGCFLLSATIPDLHKELKHSANIAYQCLVQSRKPE